MATITLILGESGTGKSTSLRNFKSDEVALVNIAAKPLPFKAKFETLSNTTEFSEIVRFLKNAKARTIVIDDCQYIMSFQYMRRLRENGWDKFNDIQSDFFNLIEEVKSLPEDVTVYFLSHIETKDDGRQKIKTIGKMLDEKITIEGMFTTVLKTYVADGKYYFLTQNSGMDTVKSPLGMFQTYAIDNDLKYVDEKIRNYYGIGEHLSDKEMEIEDERVRADEIEKPTNGRIRRTARRAENKPIAEETQTAAQQQESTDSSAQNADDEPRKRRTRKVREEINENDDFPF